MAELMAEDFEAYCVVLEQEDFDIFRRAWVSLNRGNRPSIIASHWENNDAIHFVLIQKNPGAEKDVIAGMAEILLPEYPQENVLDAPEFQKDFIHRKFECQKFYELLHQARIGFLRNYTAYTNAKLWLSVREEQKIKVKAAEAQGFKASPGRSLDRKRFTVHVQDPTPAHVLTLELEV